MKTHAASYSTTAYRGYAVTVWPNMGNQKFVNYCLYG